ncbi:MAG: hypothetical protein J5979_02095 [Lachnospiraceae bacterium]|nr:hypothetical protein [Lachnospiraceae bacterium]
MPTNERERRMAILRAALPYTAGSQRHALELLLQADTLINTAWHGPDNDLEACDMEARPEEMLLHIQEYCTPRESDLVQMILNFIKANHLFQSYREFTASHSSGNGQSDLNAAGFSGNSSNPFNMLLQLFGGFGSMGTSGNLMEFLITQLPAEQRQLFEQLRGFSASDLSAEAFSADRQEDTPVPENLSPESTI